MTMHRTLAAVFALFVLVAAGCAEQPATTSEPATAPPGAEAAGAADIAPAVAASAAGAAETAAEPARAALVAPVRGEAEIGFLTPTTRRKGNMIITTIKVKNLSKAPIAGLKVDEFWYDKAGQPVTGAQPFRHRAPLQPGEVLDVVLEVPNHPAMDRNQYKFEHANGSIKTTRLETMD